MNKYATEGSDFASNEILTTPKVYVKLAKTNVNEAAVQLSVHGFLNDGNLNNNKLNSALKEPVNLSADDENITPISIPLTWDAVEGATEYEVEADGIIQSGISENKFIHSELEYNSTHTYRVCAVNHDGYSEWSIAIEATSDLNPYRNTIDDLSISSPDDHSSYSASKLVDFNFTDYYFSDWNSATVNNREKTYMFDLKKCYQMDKVDLYPGENATYFKTHQAQEVSVYGSMDSITYTPIVDHYQLENTSGEKADTSIKSVSLNGAQMRYMRVIVHKPIGTYLALTEIMPYKVDNTEGFVLGDTNNDGFVDEKDLTQITNYVGVASTDAAWSQVEKSDYNKNNYYDAYDIAETTKRLNGGIKEVNEDVEGAIRVTANKTEVKAGESVELTINGISLKNVYAFGIRLPYNTDDFSNPSTSSTYSTMAMTKFDFARNVTDGVTSFTRYYNVVFSNLGN